jgi:hypothetical protein
VVIKGRNRDTAWFAATDRDWPALADAFERWLAPRTSTPPAGSAYVSPISPLRC